MEIPDHFSTPRLLVRCPRAGDGAIIHAAVEASFPELNQWMSWAKERSTLEGTEKRAAEAAKKFQARTEYNFNVHLAATGELVGKCGLHDVQPDAQSTELGYWCHSQHVGHGYITEAIAGLIRWGSAHLGLTLFVIRCDERNIKSCEVARRLGFELQGRIANDDFDHTGALRNTLIFAHWTAANATIVQPMKEG